MEIQNIISELKNNRRVFKELLSGLTNEELKRKPQSDKWCLLEIICHLHDEEREDFRVRIKHLFNKVGGPFPVIDPEGWVSSRNYIGQDYENKLRDFLKERDLSIQWLESLNEVDWSLYYTHPKFGEMSALFFLNNWLAHDYLHFRQITRTKYLRVQALSGIPLNYAGRW